MRKIACCESTELESNLSFLNVLKDRMVCLDHVDHLCRCKFHQRCLRYQLTVEDLDDLLSQLKDRAEAEDRWKRTVQGVVSQMGTDCDKPGW